MPSVNVLWAWRLKVDWPRTKTYTDESAYLVSATGRQSVVVPGDGVTSGRGTADQATFVLENTANRFGFFGSTLSTWISSGGAHQCPVTFEVSKNGVWYTLFTGRIKSMTQSAWQAGQINTVTLECRSMDDALLQDKRSTLQSDFAAWAGTPKREGEIIAALLTAAGYTDGVHFRSAAAFPASTTIDRGLFVLPWVWLDDESLLEEIWAIAGACGGLFYTSPDGLFTYQAMDRWLFPGAATALDSYTAISPVYDDRELFSGAIIEVNEREAAGFQTVWEPDSPPVVPSGVTNFPIVARWNAPMLTYGGISYRAVTDGGRDITGSVTITTSPPPTIFAQRALFGFNNPTAFAAIIRNLSISGRPVVGARGEEMGLSSSDAFWSGRTPRIKSVRGNPYIQTTSHARGLVRFLRDRFEKPHLYWKVTGTEVPNLPMGQRVTIYEAGLAMNPPGREGHIIGRQWSAGPGGYVETLDVVDRTTLFPGLSPQAQRGQVFY
jgi:hypothetical protein